MRHGSEAISVFRVGLDVVKEIRRFVYVYSGFAELTDCSKGTVAVLIGKADAFRGRQI